MKHFSRAFAHSWLASGRTIEGLSDLPELTEAELHELIRAECARRGWIALHGDMTRPSGRTLGEPDYVICADHGRVFFVECKSATGNLSPAQFALRAQARLLGHEIHVVRSLDAFLALVSTNAPPPKRFGAQAGNPQPTTGKV